MNDEQLTAEIKRAFGRYRAMPASIEELAGNQSHPPGGLRRPAILGLSAGGVLLALCLAIAALVLQPFAPTPRAASAFASWKQAPTSPDPAMARWASSHCTDTKLPLVIQDQRGTASVFVFREGSSFVMCEVWTIDTPTEKGWFSATYSGTFDNSDQPIELSGELQSWAAAGDSIDAVVGQASGASSVLIVTAEGLEVQASVRDGIFAAWWPTVGTQNPNVREIRSYGADGTLIGDLQVPQSSASPWIPGTPEPSPSGPPIPAES